ncbi:hypothetical protein AB4072_02040 [Microvirga sp. 2MCAF38]|uniref:DUF1254 domain-containing protein n=1 Tax=Microvirga sp. 2MCAF38 TaxID=3232989 RepID=UPI003F97DC89
MRFFIATLCGLVLAMGVHIAVILASPRLAENDAFSRLQDTLEFEHPTLIDNVGGANTWLPEPDPAIAVAACAFDLSEGPTRISTKTGPLFQSLSFHTKEDGIFFAVTDRAAVRGELDIVIMTPEQLDAARAIQDDGETVSQDVRIVAPQTEGFVIVRVASPYPSLNTAAENTATAVSCTIDED